MTNVERRFQRLIEKGMVHNLRLKEYRELEAYAWEQGYEMKPSAVPTLRSITARLVIHE